MDFDLLLRMAIYRHFAERAAAPTLDDMAAEAARPREEIKEAYRRLYAKRLLVPMPDGEAIRMAPPFSGIETQHRVRANGKEYFANCAWDSFGVAAALRAEGEVVSRCEQTREPLRVSLQGQAGPPLSEWRFHVAVPAVHWWRDIVYT
jgi:hypothetical protein